MYENFILCVYATIKMQKRLFHLALVEALLFNMN